MFDKILIANRGEIALRVIRAAREMGIATVAVHSTADSDAMHVRMADESICIGPPASPQSYLSIPALIAACEVTGAQAIHPGYGFLSENPDFVDACAAAGLVFIGPSATAIRAMGLKDNAKILMQEAGVPVVPGYLGEDQDPAHLAAEAGKIGYPVLIKAVAGGGGKGMRLVESAAGFSDALTAAKAEALNGFGNDHVLIEKYIQQPRHIEVQVFGDGKRAVHLFERDCSLQRRHQKVIEEAPAPDMTDEVRAAMGAAAVTAAEAIGYSGAGTIEFIVDGAGGLRVDGFWFMEMNTRLQVEHPVTEAITGVDLVEWQLRVAAGEPLPKAQDELQISGHSFEARLYAEDVPAGFLPATGKLTHLVFPDGARADSGVRAGDVISPFYDPMIAKLTVHGGSRSEALGKLARVLEMTEVAGSVTNLAFLRALALHEGFERGDVDTGLIARDLDALVVEPTASSAVVALAALGAARLDQASAGDGFALWAPLLRTVSLRVGEDEIEAKIATLGGGRFEVTLAEHVHKIERGTHWVVDGESFAAKLVTLGDDVSVFAGHGFHFSIVDPLEADASHAGDGNLIEAPMPGLVKGVFAKAGQSVSAGDRLAILEAMKMEHALLAVRDGVVAEVLVAEGDQVEAGAALIQLEEIS